ncbi:MULTISPECIES: 2-hydroxyacid dehydrogenase [Brevibacillus]|jgi:glyoxylate reductase/gluconate 2-dehydrogenase|uniref:2-hydroxyacid dehydrogenase n=1 Tax=Brevibacillus TaxID=55080 RepID=UPI00046920A3|nr:D-glycerate dehydrogenase [Brevibacillus borstelensis]KKX52597.1 glyoxylate reductase [Brevibacillus borstelensis cifa_chp40]MBE5395696.1 D-glycerate dehydrogenase [Brevibacillus borstelensis]MCC0565098.1 D-glycerate dehydrogenase [Brevibacillus borstelensis]MCM3471839.1 D-glycerate dehydrogenase [Brevibacillus borstelensis]MCM3561072.1 D-glycerate dehydrogenase [Brevibacillus borstelensis]
MTKPLVFVPHRIAESALALLRERCEVDYRDIEEKLDDASFAAGLQRADGLMIYSRHKINASVLEKAPRLRVVSNIAVGYDNLDLPALTARGILATNTPDVLTETTADLTFALLMAAARRVPEADRFVKNGQWNEWLPSLMLGKDVHGATIGIVGMGRIGEAVARRAKGFDMNILYFNRSRKPEAEKALGVQFTSLDDLLSRSDYVVVMTPLTPETEGLIGERELALMKSDAILINTSRGRVVDEQALIRSLTERRIGGAGLDVFQMEPTPKDNPLLSLPHVVTLPHIGSATRETREKMALKAARNMLAGLFGKRPENLLNPS